MQKYKYPLIGIFVLLSIEYSYGQLTLNRSNVIVAGKIKNLTENTISIISLEVTGRKVYSINIQEDGSFKATFDILSSHNNYIIYNNRLVNFFLEPSDSLYFTADAMNFDESIQFYGDNSSSSNALKVFFYEFQEFGRIKNFFSIKRSTDPAEFKNGMKEFFKTLDTKVDSLKTKYQYNDKIITWMKAYIKYRCADELFEFGIKYSEELPEDFYDFFDDYKTEKRTSDFYCSKYYHGFIDNYYVYAINRYEENGFCRI